ncbi:MAG: MBL fold metallo-hydrolase [Gemmatimonadota bacterium]
MKLTFLGTGTSFGIPVIGCGCEVCTSSDLRDRRTRHAALVSWEDGRTVLVDTPPELRLQLVRAGVERVDAVWFTHIHADHVHGIDDLRIFSIRTRTSIEAYTSGETREALERRFDYIFDPGIRPGKGSSKPQITLKTLVPNQPTELAGEAFVPLEVPHGSMRVLGFRVGALGYITDAKRLPARTLEALEGVRVLVLNALWWGSPHPSHFSVEEAVETATRVGAEKTFLTHFSHRVSHAELDRNLPPEVSAAFDGLTVEIPDDTKGALEVTEPAPGPNP